MFNPLHLLKIKGLWERFSKNHPRLLPFAQRIYPAAIGEGTVFDLRVQAADGTSYHYNMKLSAEDMQIIHETEDLFGQAAAEEQKQ
ncbi:MAG TPA: hypothetical protein PLN48_00660 [Lachnospiraceae bacterium]|nr:hypothetical protein [Lachnospiraceae bacterium]